MRPFIYHSIRSKVIRGSVDPNGSPAPQSTQRAYGLCEGAANRLISIGKPGLLFNGATICAHRLHFQPMRILKTSL